MTLKALFSKALSIFLITALMPVAMPAQPAYAADVTVDITVDELDRADAGNCTSATLSDYDGAANASLDDISLREAICFANASAGSDTITVPAGTYTLTTGAELLTSSDMTINGAGAGTTIIQASTRHLARTA